MGAPKVSIIISVFEQLAYTQKCLEKLEDTLGGLITYEVIIVDDASKDGTKEFLLSLKSPYQIFLNSTNQGFAKNNNFAAEKAKGEFLCFLNNDVFVMGNWLLPMIEVFKTKEKVGMVGNVQRLANSWRYDHMGMVFSPQAIPCHYGQGFFRRPFKGEVRQWSAVTAACCVTSKKNFQLNGAFDEIFINGCEDVDLCLRMTKNGLNHYVVHDSEVSHIKGASEGRKKFNDRNTKLLLNRWRGTITIHQSIDDQYKYAWTYFCRAFVKPLSLEFGRWVESTLILLKLRKLISSKS
jgi:GT2 family glycosyltransferase